MARTSRLPGFYKVTVAERRALVGDATGSDPRDIERALDAGGLDAETADKFVENVLGTYALPYAVTLNVRVNDRDRVVPMVIEEPSVVAAASNAAKLARAGGGFRAETDPPLMIAQVQLREVRNAETAVRRIAEHADEIVDLANRALGGLVARGGGWNTWIYLHIVGVEGKLSQTRRHVIYKYRLGNAIKSRLDTLYACGKACFTGYFQHQHTGA